jgi:Tfp pilus assembly protein PilV
VSRISVCHTAIACRSFSLLRYSGGGRGGGESEISNSKFQIANVPLPNPPPDYRRREPRRTCDSPALRRRSGLGLFEALISLVIMSGLLIAIATAFCAATNAMQGNDNYYRAAQAARVMLNRMLTQLRIANTWTLTGSSVLNVAYTDPITAASISDTYTFSSTASTLTVQHAITTTSTTTTTFTLPVSFTSVSFTQLTGSTGTSVAVNMTVNVSGQTVSLSGAAAPRKALTY